MRIVGSFHVAAKRDRVFAEISRIEATHSQEPVGLGVGSD